MYDLRQNECVERRRSMEWCWFESLLVLEKFVLARVLARSTWCIGRGREAWNETFRRGTSESSVGLALSRIRNWFCLMRHWNGPTRRQRRKTRMDNKSTVMQDDALECACRRLSTARQRHADEIIVDYCVRPWYCHCLLWMQRKDVMRICGIFRPNERMRMTQRKKRCLAGMTVSSLTLWEQNKSYF